MRANFETEIRLFLDSVLLGNRNVTDLMTADYTFVNDSLARQYGIQGVLGPQFRRVTLKDENRWGLLGKGAVQLRTSYGDRTSPGCVGNTYWTGFWARRPRHRRRASTPICRCTRDSHQPRLRARLEAHRANPTCKGCHGVMDPYGLAMENFDVTGRWRTVDAQAKQPIDPTAELDSASCCADRRTCAAT